MMQSVGHGARGLTITETVAIIAVLAILGAAAMPFLRDSLTASRNTKAIADIRVMWGAIKLYRQTQGEHPISLADVGFQDLKDPWGNLYVYLNFATVDGPVKARKDRNLKPVNSYFDLYSMGPDGESTRNLNAAKSLDDVLLARDGTFIGWGRDF